MIRKRSLLIIALVVFGFGALAWALTEHKDYAQLEIKDCNSCHQSSGVTLNHGSFWMREHRLYAEKRPNNCQDCHQQSWCLDCHQGGGIDRNLHTSNSGPDYMPKSHRSDFREIHPIRAFDDPRSCNRCHDTKNFCDECHNKFNRNDLRVQSHRRGFSDLELRPAGPRHSLFTPDMCQTCHPDSVLPKHRWSAEHAREARKNLNTCQACHADGDVCLKCHSALTGLKINPHPRNWGRISGKLKDASNNRTCIKCHNF